MADKCDVCIDETGEKYGVLCGWGVLCGCGDDEGVDALCLLCMVGCSGFVHVHYRIIICIDILQ